jgi:hypothetical protein
LLLRRYRKHALRAEKAGFSNKNFLLIAAYVGRVFRRDGQHSVCNATNGWGRKMGGD